MHNLLRDDFNNQKILILGFGKEGHSSLKMLRKLFTDMIIYIGDDNEIICDDDECVVFDKGLYKQHLKTFDLVLKSPGLVLDEQDLRDIKHLSSQSDIFLKHFRKQVIGISGTKGKSTTASLLFHILKSTRQNVVFGGNIGIPCFDLIDHMDINTIVVLELSCHQLEFVTASPYISVILNLYEEHLDHYQTFARYIQAKNNLCLFQEANELCLINSENVNQLVLPSNFVTFSNKMAADLIIDERVIKYGTRSIEITKEDTSLLGNHNIINIGVVYYLCSKVFQVSDDNFKEHLKTFSGLAHRLQFVVNIDNVDYYDDSISTANETCIEALKSIEHVETLLVGGMDRKINYTPLIDYLLTNYSNNLILMYESGERIYTELLVRKSATSPLRVYLVSDLAKAVNLAKQITKQGACVLSPAAASYGYFKNFEHRGDTFQAMLTNQPK